MENSQQSLFLERLFLIPFASGGKIFLNLILLQILSLDFIIRFILSILVPDFRRAG